MEYNIEVKELLLEEDRLTLTVMGTVTDDIINSHFVSKPKVILHFINKVRHYESGFQRKCSIPTVHQNRIINIMKYLFVNIAHGMFTLRNVYEINICPSPCCQLLTYQIL